MSFFVLECLFEIRINEKYNSCLRMLKGLLTIFMILNCFLAYFPILNTKMGDELSNIASKWQKTFQNASISLEEMETMVETQDWKKRVEEVENTLKMQEKIQNGTETEKNHFSMSPLNEREIEKDNIKIGEVNVCVDGTIFYEK